MGKKSRGKRERKAETAAAPQSEGAARIARRLADAARDDDPAAIRAVAAEMGPTWLLTEIPTNPMPFSMALALSKAPRCLGAMIEIAAPEAGRAFAEDPLTSGGAAIVKGFSEAVQSLSFLAAAFERDNEPHPSEPIRRTLDCLISEIPGEAMEIFGTRMHPLVAEDWKHVEAERAAAECRLDLERAAGPATAESRIRDLDD